MTMTINLSAPSSSASVSSAREIQGIGTAAFDPQAARLPQDTVTVNRVSDLVKTALNQPETRMDKVSALTTAIAAGSYKVDPKAVVTAMLSDQL